MYTYSVRSKSNVGLKTPEWTGQSYQPILVVDNVFSKSKRTLFPEQKPVLNCQTLTVSLIITFMQMCTDVAPFPSVQLNEGCR